MKTNPPSSAKHPKSEPESLVIHHPEENQTELERWVRKNIVAGGPKVWGLLALLLVAAIVAPLLLKSLGGTDTSNTEAWEKMFTAKTAQEQGEVASDFPDSKAAPWALLQAASMNLSDAVDRLPTNLDTAKPLLTKALDQFEEVLKRSPKSSLLARHASFGMARTLEVRNELDKAIAQYETIVRDWPDSPEAAQSKRLANQLRAELKKPEAERFYNKLYAFKTPEITLPPLGGTTLPSGVPAGSVLDELLKRPPSPPPGDTLPPVFTDEPKKDTPEKEKPQEKPETPPKPEGPG